MNNESGRDSNRIELANSDHFADRS